jgi:hypothetical protein
MKATWKSLVFAGVSVYACVASGCSPAKAQSLPFGYLGPAGPVVVTTGNYGYWGGLGYYRAGYPVLAPRVFIARPTTSAYVRPPVILGGQVVVRRPYLAVRPYARYYPRPVYYRRVW